MYYVYVIQSIKDLSFYTGITENFERRLKEHNDGKESYTRHHAPYVRIILKEVANRIEARKIEKKLKLGYLRQIRDKNINDFIEIVKNIE